MRLAYIALLAAILGIAAIGCNQQKSVVTTKTNPTVAVSVTSADDALSSLEDDADSESNAEQTSHMPMPKSAPPAGYEFEAPVRIKAGGEFVSVESPGYACPTMADIDGDGDDDLVVGQFNQGHMQFCENTAGAGDSPQFAAATWIQSDGSRAIVPGVW